MAISISIPRFDPLGALSSPARALSGIIDCGAITPSNTDDYGDGIYARWIYVGTTGNITFVKWDGTTGLMVNAAAGVWHPVYSKRVNLTGTSASNLLWGA